MGTMASRAILFLLWSTCRSTSTSGATPRPPILDLTEELLRDFEKAQVQTARGEEDLNGEEHLVQHLAGFSHDHKHREYDGHQHVDDDHRLEQHHHDDQHQHHQEQVNHQHIEHQHEHEDGTKHSHLLPIYESIKNEQADVLTQIERLYSEFQSHSAERARTHEFPLVSLVESSPNSMTVMVSPKKFRPDIMVRLLYERVPLHRKPFVQHLDDPVIEYYPMIREAQTYTLAELPRGKYIVCGEAMTKEGEIMQASCFETQISRRDDNSLQNGVKAMIVIAFVVVALVVVYAILYQVWKKTCSSRHKRKEQKSFSPQEKC